MTTSPGQWRIRDLLPDYGLSWWTAHCHHSLNERIPAAEQLHPTSVLRGLQEALRKGEFKFSLQRGVLQRRKGKDPRPIVVSPVTNRIVQRAILETLQSQAPSTVRRLGDIPIALSTPTSVGGIPGKGASDAVRIISKAIREGATHYIRSDVKDFFTKVPTARLIESIRQQTGDDEFTDLIQDGLAV